MAITDTSYLYEVLIRGDADGLKAAHQITMRRVADGDTVLSEAPSPATPLALADVESVLGAAFPGLAAERDAAVAAATSAQGDLAAKTTELTQAQADLATANAEIARLSASPPPPTVAEVTRAQAKIALSRSGLLAQVETAVTAAGGEAAIWYADALTWRRDNPYVASLGEAVGLTSAQVDDLFATAATIQA